MPPALPRAPVCRLPQIGIPARQSSAGALGAAGGRGRSLSEGSRRLLATEPRETKDRKDLLGHCPAFCSTLPAAGLLTSPVFWVFFGTRVQYGS